MIERTRSPFHFIGMDNGHFPKVKDSFTWSHYSPFTDTPGWWNNPPSGYHNCKMFFVGTCPFVHNHPAYVDAGIFDMYTVARSYGFIGDVFQYSDNLLNDVSVQ